MSTTTIRLPEQLKARTTRAAEQAGKSTHAFILEAIAEKTELEEARADLQASADQRYARLMESGEAVSWGELVGYLEQRAAGLPAERPKARKLAR